MLRIAINGFGRIGKAFVRALLQDQSALAAIDVVAINTGKPASPFLEHLFKYDSALHGLHETVSLRENSLKVANQTFPLIAELDPAKLPWKNLAVDWVIDCSGKFTTKENAQFHINAGAKKVLISAPVEDADITIIPGVNGDQYNENIHQIISLGSCTTNCFAPVVKVIHEAMTLETGMMTTVHAYTNDQVIVDGDHKDPRRARAAAQNIIPTKTGAEKTITKIYPQLEGKLKAHAVRVPVIDGSMIDFSFLTKEKTSSTELNDLFKAAAEKSLLGTLKYIEAPLVSSDVIGSSYASIVDGLLTQSTGNMSRICAWYDNEFGYASRMKEFLLHL